MSLFALAAIAVFFVVQGARAGSPRRQFEAPMRPRGCRACLLEHPPFASYCRHCGRHLD
jgi:hypothetical protein